jgi:hypothetical protein
MLQKKGGKKAGLRKSGAMGPFDLHGLPAELADKVAAALPDGADCEDALAAIETYVRRGGERTGNLLLVWAALTFEDARRLVLHRIGEAGTEALALIDEARRLGARGCALDALVTSIAGALAREARRDAHLRRALDGEPAKATELVELAHAMIRKAEDDRTAAWLLRRACGSNGPASGVFEVPKRVAIA